MSGKRLNKRQLREQQELQALEEVSGDAGGAAGSSSAVEDETAGEASQVQESAATDEEDEAEEHPQERRGGAGLFAQLGSIEADDESEDKDINVATPAKAKSKNKKKKRKKPSATAQASAEGKDGVEDNSIPPVAAAAPGRAKGGKKAGAGAAAAIPTPKKDVSDMSMDEFTALLATQAQIDQSAAENGHDPSALANVTPLGPLSTLRVHLALSAPALDPAVELKRQFGAAAIKAYEAEAGGTTGQAGSASAGARARAQAWNTNLKVRSILVQPKETWPPIARTFTGMSMEVFDAAGRGKVGGWIHSKAYREAQLQFLQAVSSYEPNHLMTLLRMYPWHIDTLLQLSDVSRHQGDLGQASDFNARALFAFERTAIPLFTASLTSHLGPPMLQFERVEDRGFWLASHRHVNFMGRRGTWRTALEWVKLIIGIDPTCDHHGMLLWLDFLSIKSRQHAWFLECLGKLDAAVAQDMDDNSTVILAAKTAFDDEDKPLVGEGKGCRGALDWYVGLAYAKALAIRASEREAGDASDSRKSTAALRLAIARHPYVMPRLLDKIGASMPKGVPSDHALFQYSDNDTIPEILTHIYVVRSESLWREQDVSGWLTKTLQEVWPALQSSYDSNTWQCAAATSEKARNSVYRHVLVSDLPDALRQTLVGLMPREITSNSAMLNAFDPLPPQGEGATTYDGDYFAAARSRRDDNDDAYVEMNGAASAGILDRLFNALRGVRGLEAWGAAMEQMDDAGRQDVLADIVQMAQQQGDQGGMPGALAGIGGADDADEDGHADGETDQARGEAAAPGSFGGIRELLQRLWGQAENGQTAEEANNGFTDPVPGEGPDGPVGGAGGVRDEEEEEEHTEAR